MILNINGGKLYYETSEDIQTTNKPVLFVLPGGPGGDKVKFQEDKDEHGPPIDGFRKLSKEKSC